MSEPLVTINGSRDKPKGVKLTTTGATPVIAGPTSGSITVESLRYSCGAGGTSLSIWVTDGVTSWYMLNGATIAAGASVPIEDHIVLFSGWSINAQAADANRIDIILVPVLSGQSGTST